MMKDLRIYRNSSGLYKIQERFMKWFWIDISGHFCTDCMGKPKYIFSSYSTFKEAREEAIELSKILEARRNGDSVKPKIFYPICPENDS